MVEKTWKRGPQSRLEWSDGGGISKARGQELQRQSPRSISGVWNGLHWQLQPISRVRATGKKQTKKKKKTLPGRGRKSGAEKRKSLPQQKLTILLVISGLKMSAQDASPAERGRGNREVGRSVRTLYHSACKCTCMHLCAWQSISSEAGATPLSLSSCFFSLARSRSEQGWLFSHRPRLFRPAPEHDSGSLLISSSPHATRLGCAHSPVQ